MIKYLNTITCYNMIDVSQKNDIYSADTIYRCRRYIGDIFDISTHLQCELFPVVGIRRAVA